jgi:hypothetical protein
MALSILPSGIEGKPILLIKNKVDLMCFCSKRADDVEKDC